MTRQQGPNETVEQYSEDMIRRLTLAGCKEPQLWTTYVKGLRPLLRARVLAKHPTDIHMATTFAQELEQLLKLERQETNDKISLNMMEPEDVSKLMDPFLKIMTKSMTKMVNNIQPAVTPAPQTADNDNSNSHQPRGMRPSFPRGFQNRYPRNRPQFSSPQTASGDPPFCSFCNIPGHTFHECRRKYRFLCWTCDRFSHFQKDCPRGPAINQNSPSTQNAQQSGN